MRKSTELIKRVLTGIVAAALVATALPFSAFAKEEIEVIDAPALRDSDNNENRPPESGSWHNDENDYGVWSLDKDGILTIESQGSAGTTLMNVQDEGDDEVRRVSPFIQAGHDP